jgi:hypothetical protein
VGERAVARIAVVVALGVAGMLAGACAGILPIDDVTYGEGGVDGTVSEGGADGTGSDAVPPPSEASGEETGTEQCHKQCVICVDAADPTVGCDSGDCMPCPGPANGAATCKAGHCDIACTGSFGDCNGILNDGCEADLSSDPRNCGGCNRPCGPGNVCDNSMCKSACTGGKYNCDAACVDIQTSAGNCGACGRACDGGPNATPVCDAGACGFTCSSNYLDCTPEAGCETPPGDPKNCGACGKVCGTANTASVTCVNGACVIICKTGYSDCDGDPSNGCECDLFNHNCGGKTCVLCAPPTQACAVPADCCHGGTPGSVDCFKAACCVKNGFPCKPTNPPICCSGKCDNSNTCVN